MSELCYLVGVRTVNYSASSWQDADQALESMEAVNRDPWDGYSSADGCGCSREATVLAVAGGWSEARQHVCLGGQPAA